MRLVPFLCAMAFATGASAQTTTPTAYATPSVSAPWQPMSFRSMNTHDRTASPVYIPPLAVNAYSTGPLKLRILNQRDRWSELYEPTGYRDDPQIVVLEYRGGMLPKSLMARLVIKGLHELYESKRIRNEPSWGYKLPNPDEKKVEIEFTYPICPVGAKC